MLRQSMCSYQIMEIGRVPNAHLLSPNKTFSIRIRLHLVGFLAEGFTQESTKKIQAVSKTTGCSQKYNWKQGLITKDNAYIYQ